MLMTEIEGLKAEVAALKEATAERVLTAAATATVSAEVGVGDGARACVEPASIVATPTKKKASHSTPKSARAAKATATLSCTAKEFASQKDDAAVDEHKEDIPAYD
jgi:hypothetical protein